MINAKRMFISSLVTAKDTVNNLNKQADEEGFITYLTPTGWIVGKSFELEKIDATNEETLIESITQLQEEGKEIDLFSMAFGITNAFVEKRKEDNDVKDIAESFAIPLTDVQIISNTGSKTNLSHFVLFSDQVIGVVPGKMSF